MQPLDAPISYTNISSPCRTGTADPWPVPLFHVTSVRRNADRVDERIGELADGRRIRATISAGVLEIEVANPLVNAPKRRRYYHLHRGKMRTIMLKVIGGYTKHALTYTALKAHTQGYIAWPDKESREV